MAAYSFVNGRSSAKYERQPLAPMGRFRSGAAIERYSIALSNRDILPERGFLTNPNVLIRYPSFLHEEIRHMGWIIFANHPEVIYPQVVREVYANLPFGGSNTVYFRGNTVDISRKAINDLLGVDSTKRCQFEAMRKGKKTEEMYTNIIKSICYKGTKWRNMLGDSRTVTFDQLLPGMQVWCHFVGSSLCPTRYTWVINEEIATLLFCIAHEYHIDIGRIIALKLRAHTGQYADMIFPAVIGGLMRKHYEKNLEEWAPVDGELNPTVVRAIMVPEPAIRKEPEADSVAIQQGSPPSI